jgi:very-long-chain (3R)-3-hydroxyacyl-CoA dehydratase
LFLYNLTLAGGWGYLLYLTVNHYVHEGKPENLYPVIEVPLKVFQTLAVMEIVHSLLGLVSSPVFTTVMQVWSRLFVVWMVIDLEHQVRYTVCIHNLFYD